MISLAFTLLLFPIVAVCFCILGFLLGIPITPWVLPLAYSVCLSLLLIQKQKRETALFTAILLGLFLWNSTNLISYGSDTISYHGPMTILLARGWNPFTISTPEALCAAFDLAPETFRSMPTVTMPRFAQLFSAACYASLKIINAGDILDPLLLICLFLAVRCWLPLWGNFQRWASWVFPVLISFSPFLPVIPESGPTDTPFYALTLLTVFSLETARRTGRLSDLKIAVLAAPALATVKFTGCLTVGLVALCYSLPLLRRFSPQKLLKPVAMTLCLFLLMGSTPYLTNFLNYGSPFYPVHTFRNDVHLPDMTGDFRGMNADAASMGAAERFVYAYLSRSAVKAARTVLGDREFSPEWLIPIAAEGWGTPFRAVLCFSLLLFATGKKRHPLILPITTIFLTSIAVPSLYTGYGRYVAQLSVIPALITLEVLGDPSALRLRRQAALGLLGMLLLCWFGNLMIQAARVCRRQAADLCMLQAVSPAPQLTLYAHRHSIPDETLLSYGVDPKLPLLGNPNSVFYFSTLFETLGRDVTVDPMLTDETAFHPTPWPYVYLLLGPENLDPRAMASMQRYTPNIKGSFTALHDLLLCYSKEWGQLVRLRSAQLCK